MRARTVMACLIGGAFLLQLFGCGGEEAKKSNVVPVKKIRVKAEKPAQNAGALQEHDSAPQEVKYVYDPAARRDPFEVLVMIKKPVIEQGVPLTPLQKYDLGQFKLGAIIIGEEGPIAMVIAPGGKSYVIKKGDKIGRNGGVITEMTLEAILVEEKYYDFAGELKRARQEIRLAKKAGED
jgi:type IV pilus assembly protein PilP